MALHRKNFTLLELVAVVAIMTLVLGISVSVLRKRSGPAQFENSVLTFRQFCMAARAQAAELGHERVLYYQPEERTFRAGDVQPVEVDRDAVVLLEPPDQEPEMAEYETPANFSKLKWVLPEEYVMEMDSTGAPEESRERVELFHFFPDGSASGVREFRLQFRSWSRTLAISPLTGELRVEEGSVL